MLCRALAVFLVIPAAHFSFYVAQLCGTFSLHIFHIAHFFGLLAANITVVIFDGRCCKEFYSILKDSTTAH